MTEYLPQFGPEAPGSFYNNISRNKRIEFNNHVGGPERQVTGCDATRWKAANSRMAHLIQTNTIHNTQARKQAMDELKAPFQFPHVHRESRIGSC
jgi:hypothetical protein